MNARTPKPTKRAKANGKSDPTKDAQPTNGTNPGQPQANGSATHQGNGTLPVGAEILKPPSDRNELGQFVSGHNGGPGRPLGSRNKLVEDFLTDFHTAWKANGADALKKMVADEPAAFVRAAVQLMPRDVLVEARGAGLVVVETPSAIKALLEALPDLGVLPVNGSRTVATTSNVEEVS